ncbi:MAG: hypothetical protein ACJAZ3_000814 [Sphingobacteriales bacterium]|jgi:uncharacterized protein (DUF885 family)
MKSILLVLIPVLFLSACKEQQASSTTENESFNQMLVDYNEGKTLFDPITATFLGKKEFNGAFAMTLSDSYKAELKSFYSKFQKENEQYKDSELTEEQQLSKALIAWDCDIELSQAEFKHSAYMPIDQMWTVNLSMGQLASATSAQPFKTVEDYTNWFNRTRQYNQWLLKAIAKMKEGIEEGYVLPTSLISKVIPQFQVLAETPLKDNLFYSSIRLMPKDFSPEDKEQMTKEYSAFLEGKLIPTFSAMYEFLKTDYNNAGRASSGLSDLPNGSEYYKHSIKKYTTTTMSAEEIHQLGLKEVARILTEMEKVKTQVGFEGTIKEFFNHVRENKTLMPYSEPLQIIDNFNAIHAKMTPQLEKLFDKKPMTEFVVKQTEKFREASASAQYNSGSLKDNRPGIFYVPIIDASKYNVFSDEALFLHEAIPGHHYQISLVQENESLPEFRRSLWYSAYGEGWALYCESLGKELGLYTDPYQYFGMLGMEMHRAIRLVVDAGMHAKGWTREQAIQYSLDNEAESEAGIISEIERYMAKPGQALSYKIGQLKILELRAKAEIELGEKFDIREFHNQVLETGCIPLALLEVRIDRWITETK